MEFPFGLCPFALLYVRGAVSTCLHFVTDCIYRRKGRINYSLTEILSYTIPTLHKFNIKLLLYYRTITTCTFIEQS